MGYACIRLNEWLANVGVRFGMGGINEAARLRLRYHFKHFLSRSAQPTKRLVYGKPVKLQQVVDCLRRRVIN